jgi:hypothetical protein
MPGNMIVKVLKIMSVVNLYFKTPVFISYIDLIGLSKSSIQMEILLLGRVTSTVSRGKVVHSIMLLIT